MSLKRKWAWVPVFTVSVLLSLISTTFALDFTDVTDISGSGDPGHGMGAAFSDVDGDGDADLYVSNKGGGNALYINDGTGTFVKAGRSAGSRLDDAGMSMGSCFGDIDNDGDPDLYIVKGGRYQIEANRLLLNEGGRFVDVTDRAGVGSKEFTYSAAFADVDNDGYLDLYLANYGMGARNALYRNRGDGTFTDITDAAGVGDRSWSWSAVFSDINGDGFQDLYVVNGRYPSGEPNRMYQNRGDGTFSDVSRESGTDDGNWGLGAAFADVDNDGDLDLFEGDANLSNKLYLNDGKGVFSDVSDRYPVLRHERVRTKGTAFADVDNDGDLDLYVVNWGTENRLFRNEQNDGLFLKLRLKGTVSNSDAVGARVRVSRKGKIVGVREVKTLSGFCSQPPLELHFGLPEAGLYRVDVVFPSGMTHTGDYSSGQIVNIEEGT